MRVQSFVTSYDELIAAAEQAFGGAKFDVVRTPYENAASRQRELSQEGFLAWLYACVADGRALLEQDKLANERIGLKPSKTTPAEVIKSMLQASASYNKELYNTRA